MFKEKQGGKFTPGQLLDISLDQQIKQLNLKYKHINFGMEIDNSTFDFFLPRRIDKEANTVLYR